MKFNELINKITLNINENKDYLNELDAAIGDGDHGTNVARALVKVSEQLESLNNLDLATKLNKIAMLILSNVGGSSGPLLATWLMGFAKELKANNLALDYSDFINYFASANEALRKRGNTAYNNKTMYDVLYFVEEKAKEVNNYQEFVANCANWANSKLQETKDIIAKSGRASYLGPRSIGHYDPGSYTIYLICLSVNEVFNG
ncbi:dihydroxyacetone kinase subunit L [Mycoplasma sp. NEAQ87857]|uniref:dihydroxyacetone kinase subunit DhaL n=1 Tax=Mycoplasma sp. NEAQ87857 TaxID=2683967 RepID=UPI00131897B6|nr:dihydroxyacetone kinase subunit DhaL [Mycoplasma sp. NEAQ87857]QGZ97424.1 dihydroxyacetone kinase subunit L [Mycoplasma sp. NEAQ87857]